MRQPYFRHFGLERDPFLDTADPAFYHATPEHERIERRLMHAIRQSRGITVVVGDPGLGKTSLAGALERSLLVDDDVRLGKILDPSFSGDVEFLLAVARAFGLELPPRSPAALKNAFKNFLFDTAILEKHTVVLFIDEAQLLDAGALESLRLLQNYHVPERKLLNVVLFGQQELRPKVAARPNFADRVDTWVELNALDGSNARALLAFRLGRAGRGELDSIFEPDAVTAIVAAAGGTPRRLISLARGAMEEAALRGRARVQHDDAVATARARGLSVASTVRSSPETVAAPSPAAPPPEPATRTRWSDLLRSGGPWRRTKT